MQVYFALFDTAIGRCGLAWGEHGIVGVQLPEANARKMVAWRGSARSDARGPGE
jgi:hypothetical protein